jgi:hypothetical protein
MAKQTVQKLRIDYLRLTEIQTAKRNAKKHAKEQIQGSINRFGYTAPMLLDERTGRLVAGHGRLSALRALKARDQAPPARIEVDSDGDWLVPVLRGIAFNSEAEAEAYLLADNRLTELGGYDDQALQEILRSVNADTGTLEGTGWSTDDIAAALEAEGAPADGAAADGEDDAADEDEAEEVRYDLLIRCDSEDARKSAFERLRAQGFEVEVLSV